VAQSALWTGSSEFPGTIGVTDAAASMIATIDSTVIGDSQVVIPGTPLGVNPEWLWRRRRGRCAPAQFFNR
jgi:hypothetical protein